jgi:hypothetical protein
MAFMYFHGVGGSSVAIEQFLPMISHFHNKEPPRNENHRRRL